MEKIVNGRDTMRLYNIYYICKTALGDLKNVSKESLNNGSVRVIGWPACRNSLATLGTLDFIKQEVNDVYEALNPIDREKTNPDVGNNTYSSFNSAVKKLIVKIEAVIDLYESMKEGDSKPGLDIKIPPCDDLKEYINILKEIDFVFSQCPYLKHEDEELRYNGTDVGSDWITFTLVMADITAVAAGGFYIFNNLAHLINKAIALKANFATFKMQEEALESIKQKNEVGRETIEVFEQMKKMTYEKYVNELAEEIGSTKDGEEEGKVEKSLEKLANLIDKGVEIYTSIETPKEIKVLFPFSEKQEALPDGLMKYLEDKNIPKGPAVI